MEDIKQEGGLEGRKKIGLALGGGGAKGLAHIGVIKILEKAEVPIDFIAGTSMGALVGGWYAVTKNIFALEKLFQGIDEKDILPMEKLLADHGGALFSDKTLVELLRLGFGSKKCDDCQIPFVAVATDVESGEEVVLKDGEMVEVIEASVALPIIFKPVKIGNRLLMDGGFVNPVPADVVRAMGADFVIAVDVASRWVSIPSDDLEDLKQTKNMYDFVHQLMTGLQYNIAKHVLEKADTVIKVPLTTFSWMEFNRAAEIIKRGEDGAREKLKEIRKKSGYENKIKRSVLEKFMINLFGE